MSAKGLSWTVVLIGVVISIIGSAYFLTRSRSEATLSGTYIARMQQPGKRAYTIRLQLEVTGAALRGDITYPTGRGVVQQGSVAGDRLTFTTDLRDSSNSQVIRFEGRIRGREIDLIATAEDKSVAKGIARKTE